MARVDELPVRDAKSRIAEGLVFTKVI